MMSGTDDHSVSDDAGGHPDDSGRNLIGMHFDAFAWGDYSALIPLGHACLERGWRATAYAAWYLAVLKGQPGARQLVEELCRHLSREEILLGEDDVNTLLPQINKAHYD